MKPKLLSVYIVVLLSTLVCCKKDKGNEDNNTNNQVNHYELAQNAVIPSQFNNLSNTTIGKDYIALEYNSHPPQFQPGMIIVDTVQNGYLRKIVNLSVTNNTVILNTTNARFRDAFKSLWIKKTIEVKPSYTKKSEIKSVLDTTYSTLIDSKKYNVSMSYSDLTTNNFKTKDGKSFDWGWVFHDLSLNIEDDESHLAFSISCSTLSLLKTISIDFEHRIDFDGPKYLQLIKNEENSVTFEDITITGTLKIEREKKLRFLDLPVLAAIVVPPVVITVGFACEFGLNALLNISTSATINSHASYSETTKSGFTWDPSTGFTGIDEKKITIDGKIDNSNLLEAESNVSMSAGPFLEPTVDVSFYSLIGPEFFARISFPTITVSFPPLTCSLGASVDLGIRAELTMFDLPVFEFSGTPFTSTCCEGCGLLNDAKPKLLTPTDGYITSSLTPTLTCQPYPGASNYNFQIATESTFNNPIVNANNSTGQYQIASGILEAGTQYFWKVKVTAYGNFSPWSDVWSFTTYGTSMLEAPVLLSPSNNSTNILLTSTLDWKDVANATKYQLQIDENGSFTSTIVDQDNISSSQYSNPAGALQSNNKYFWRVRAKNSNSSSLWSEIWDFTTTSTTPSGIILPLAVGNYWTYFSDLTSQTVTVNITGTIPILGETCYIWHAEGDQVDWYYKNKEDGCWAYGYSGLSQYPPDLVYKYPSNLGDKWVTNWIAVPYSTTMDCASTNTTYETYSACYKYHFYLPLGKKGLFSKYISPEVEKKAYEIISSGTSGYDIYQYFVPGIGMVGWETYFDGTLLYKVHLTDYHLN
jgi:hypothetical protein